MDAEFGSGYEAIAWALRRLRTPIVKSPSIFKMGRKSAIFERYPDCSPWEKVAEAVYILKVVERNLTEVECAILQTYFTGGLERGGQVSRLVSRELDMDRWFVLDILKSWARERPRHSTSWWAKKYRVGGSTISRWQEKVVENLDIKLKSAMTGAHGALQHSGHVLF